MKTFVLTFQCRVELTEGDIWPDPKSRPPSPTNEDVLAMIKRHGGPVKVLDSWNLWNCGPGKLAVAKKRVGPGVKRTTT